MKRINPVTNTLFKYGNVREDGFLFLKYKTHKVKKNGFFEECWLNPQAFTKELNRMLNHQKSNNKKHSATTSRYAKRNQEKVNFWQAKYRADKLQRTPKWLTEEQHLEINKFYKMAKELEKVFPWKQHVDHVLPLRGNIVSGLHTPSNLQILSEIMNKQKSNGVLL
jgi:5-methylcytosine-specific restriction endonuclease McrA